MLLNSYHEPLAFTLPTAKAGYDWERLLDTALPAEGPSRIEPAVKYKLPSRSMAILRLRVRDEASPVSRTQAETIRKQTGPTAPPRDKTTVA
jgi:hypothetical protein